MAALVGPAVVFPLVPVIAMSMEKPAKPSGPAAIGTEGGRFGVSNARP